MCMPVYTANGVSWSLECLCTVDPSLYFAKQLYCRRCDIARSDFDASCWSCDLISVPCSIMHTNWSSNEGTASSRHPSRQVLLNCDLCWSMSCRIIPAAFARWMASTCLLASASIAPTSFSKASMSRPSRWACSSRMWTSSWSFSRVAWTAGDSMPSRSSLSL